MTLPLTRMSASTLRTIYLGAPGSLVALTKPDSGVAFPITRAGTISNLISGGSSKTTLAKAHRRYALQWTDRTQDDTDALVSFLTGLYGEGPFCLIDPAWRNLMGQWESTFGKQLQAISGYSISVTSSSSIAYSSVVPPVGAGGGLSWVTPAAGQNLIEGTRGGTAAVLVPNAGSSTDAGTAVPYVSDQPHTLSVYAAKGAAGSCSVALTAYGLPAAGSSSPASVSGSTVVLTTTPQLLTVTVPVGAAGFSAAATPYVALGLRCISAATSPTVTLWAPQHEVGVLTPSPWVAGLGVPRVIVAPDSATGVTFWDRRTIPLSLLEI